MYRGFSILLSLTGAFLGGWLALRFLLPLVLPFVVGLGLALAAEPLARRLRQHIGSAAAALVSVTLTACALTALAALALTFAVRQLTALSAAVPDVEEAARAGIQLAQSKLLQLSAYAPSSIRPVVQQRVTTLFTDGSALLDRVAQWVLSLAGRLLGHVPDSALALITGLISACLISARLPKLRRALLRAIPRQRLQALLATLARIRKGVGSWLLAQAKLSGVTFAVVLSGLLLLRIPGAVFWALGICLADALPLLGTGSVLLPWALLCFLQGDTPRAMGLAGIWVSSTVLRSVLEPKFLGKELGLDPLVALMALYVGYKLLGIGGLLLAPLLTVTAMQLLPQKGSGKL